MRGEEVYVLVLFFLFHFKEQFMIISTYLTGKEVAAILKISKALAYRLIAEGEIPSIRFRRTVRVKQEALDEFIQKNSSGNNPVPSQITSSELPVKPIKATRYLH
jgi:excisionase family DNA binding protein